MNYKDGMNMEYKKIEPQINDFVGDNVKKLAQLFPSAVKDGQVDFEALKEELGQFEEVGSEKYEFTWAGKQNAKKIAQEDVYGKTLKFIPEESKDADTTENLYIEGDNLEVLKLLRQNYYGAIKMIYIDPPYNTGNDFIYNDDYRFSMQESEHKEGNIDENGNRYIVNQKSSNRYHAKWLDNIYPLIKISKELLKEIGAIFISIDDNEVDNLRKVCNEIFGEDNFVACIIWNRKRGRDNSAKWFSKSHEYLLVYAKNKSMFTTNYLELDEETKKAYKNPDNDPRGDYRMLATWARGTQGGVEYDFTSKEGQYFKKRLWLFSKENLEKLDSDNKLIIRGDNIYRKLFIYENKGKIPETIWSHTSNAANASDEIKKIFGRIVFDTPKPTPYIQEMIKIATQEDDIILDFFSGSASTACAVMKENSSDGGKRKFVVVQIPASCDKNSSAREMGFNTIAEIGRERIRREGEAIKSIDDRIDVGFKTFRADKTNIRWNCYNDLHNQEVQLSTTDYLMNLEDFEEDATDFNIVYELMFRQKGVLLSEKLINLKDVGKRTYIYANSYLVCLEDYITENLIEKIALIAPLPIKFIFRDSAFGDDIALKDETFRRLKALIEKNSGTSKKAYTVEFI